MRSLLKRFLLLPLFIQVIWILCVAGSLTNACLLVRDVFEGGILWRLHMGFFLLYCGQTVFILLKEKYVVLLTLLQGVLALLSTFDFTFVPLLQLVGHLYYWMSSPSLEAAKVSINVRICLRAFSLR